MFIALVIGTAASLAPAPLAKAAIDDGHPAGRPRHARPRRRRVRRQRARSSGSATYAQTYLAGWVGQRALADLRLQIFRHLQEMPVGFYERRPAGMLISRMTNDVEALDSLVTDTVVTLFQATLTLVGSIVILLLLDVKLALIMFLIFPVMARRRRCASGSLSADAYRRTRETIGAITAYLQETLSGIRVVRTFGQEPRHLRRFAELNERNRAANMTTVNLNAAYFPAVEFLSSVATVAILLYRRRAGRSTGDIEVGVLVGFIAALNGFFDPIAQLSQVYTTYQSGMAALDKIFELLDEQPDLVDAPDADRPAAHRAARSASTTSRSATAAATARRRSSRSTTSIDDRAAGPDGRARRRDRRRQVDVRQARRALLRPDGRRVLVDGHDLRDGASRVAALADGDRARRRPSCSAARSRDNIAFGRPDATRRGRRGRGPRGRRVGLHRGACRTASTRRSASAASSSRPASASSSRSPARSSPTRASSSSTRRPRTSTCTPRAGSRPACAGCSPGAPRSSSRTACRRSARPAGSSSSTTGASSSRARTRSCSRPAGRYERLYRDWAEQAAA